MLGKVLLIVPVQDEESSKELTLEEMMRNFRKPEHIEWFVLSRDL